MKAFFRVIVFTWVGLFFSFGTAFAFGNYFDIWRGIYPASSSGLNVVNGTGRSCQLCHQLSGGGNGWNGYGWAIRLQTRAGVPIDQAIRNVVGENSDQDPTGSTNLQEIDAHTQPGWTAGLNNTIFFKNLSTLPGQPPPAGILGNLDPVAPSPPDIDVAPLAVDFGAVTVGMIDSRTVTLSNLGEGALEIQSVQLLGSPDFALGPGMPPLPLVIPAGGTSTVPINYQPTDPGSDSATLEITSDDPDEGTVSVALSGTGVPPALICDIDLQPTALMFGSVTVGEVRTLEVTIGNTGNGPCQVHALTLSGSGDFRLATGAPVPEFTVIPGAMIQVPVSYQPSDLGDDSGGLTILNDDPDEGSLVVPLSGTGEPVVAVPDIDVTPLALDFGAVTVGSTEVRMTTLRNLGDATLRVTALNFLGSPDFILGTPVPTLPLELAPGGTADLPLLYGPSAPGDDAATLEILSNDPDEGTVSVALSGTGVPPALVCDIDVDPMALMFGPVTVGEDRTLEVTIGNTGNGPCQVHALTLSGSGDFRLGAGAPVPEFTVIPGGMTRVPVSYGPSGPGDDSGRLTVVSDDPDEPMIDVSLSGRGVSATFVDLDIVAFKVSKAVKPDHHQKVRFKLFVVNAGTNDEPRQATVTAEQNGIVLYSDTFMVSDRPGDGGLTGYSGKLRAKDVAGLHAGDLLWTVTILDDDPDLDTATAVTRVVP